MTTFVALALVLMSVPASLVMNRLNTTELYRLVLGVLDLADTISCNLMKIPSYYRENRNRRARSPSRSSEKYMYLKNNS